MFIADCAVNFRVKFTRISNENEFPAGKSLQEKRYLPDLVVVGFLQRVREALKEIFNSTFTKNVLRKVTEMK